MLYIDSLISMLGTTRFGALSKYAKRADSSNRGRQDVTYE